MNKQILISTIIALSAVGITSVYALTTVDSDLAVSGAISGIGTVPIGTVLDWWCPISCTIPDGFVMADGQLITDAASPFAGQNVPLLTNKFVKGVTPTNLDTTGGTSTHSHSHDHANAVSSAAGAAHTHSHDHPITGSTNNNGNHVHSVDPPGTNSGGPSTTDSDYAEDNITTFDKTGPRSTHTHNTNIGSFNSGTQSGNHGHGVNLANQVSSAGNANHEHNTNLPNIQSSTDGNEPPWHGLVKIIRIK